MKEWSLPSQVVTTDRNVGETTEAFLGRHQMTMRLTAERELIFALDFLEGLRKKAEEAENKELQEEIATFLVKFQSKGERKTGE